METQERFPQGLGNLAQDARFPHSHKPIIVIVVERREKNGNSNSVIKPSTESDQAHTTEIDLSKEWVAIVPHRDVSSSLIEHFDAPADALLGHAEIARRLRQKGWVLTEYGSGDHAAAAA